MWTHYAKCTYKDMGHIGKYSSQKLHLHFRGIRNISTGEEEARAFPWWVLSPWHPAHTPSGPQTHQEALTKLGNNSSREKQDGTHSRGTYVHMLSFSPGPISLSFPSPLNLVLEDPAEAEDSYRLKPSCSYFAPPASSHSYLQVDDPTLLHREVCDLKALSFQWTAGIQNTFVLCLSGDQVLFPWPIEPGHPLKIGGGGRKEGILRKTARTSIPLERKCGKELYAPTSILWHQVHVLQFNWILTLTTVS